MRLERFKIQKFSCPISRSLGPSGLGAFSPPKPRPLGPWCILAPPGKKLVAPLQHIYHQNLKHNVTFHLVSSSIVNAVSTFLGIISERYHNITFILHK